MRTTLNIDGKLIDEVTKLTGEKNKGKAVGRALEEYIRRKRIAELIAMRGKVDLVDNWYELRHGHTKEEEEWLEQRRKEQPGT